MRREGRNLSEADQTLTILKSGVVGKDFAPPDPCSVNGDIVYRARYDGGREECTIDFMDLDEQYVVIPQSATPTSQIASTAATKAYCKPNGCANPACESGNHAGMQCSKCRWAKYCSAACQKSHWKAHKPNCKSISLNDELMYGRPEYIYNKKESMTPKPKRWDVKSVNGDKLVLEIDTGCFGACHYDYGVLRDPTLLAMVNEYFPSGTGCSVDVQKRANGADVIVAVFNEPAPPS